MSPKPPSSSKRSASAISIDLSPPSGSTNATYATWVCTTLAGYSTDLNSITALAYKTYELPDCFWKSLSLTTNLQYLSLGGMIVRGNINGTSGQPGSESTDPLLRIPSTVTKLIFYTCQFIATNSTSVYAPDFQTIMDWFQSLTTISFDRCYIPGTMFTTMPPNLQTVTASNLGLTGTISPSLFSSIVDDGRTGISISWDLTFNQLTGSIPSSLFSRHFDNQFDVVALYLGGNQLTGTLPADLLPTWKLNTFFFSVASNGLTGSLPSQFFNASSVPPASPTGGRAVSIELSSNQFSGSVPSDFLGGFYGLLALTLRASNNSLTGAVPAFFSDLPPGSGLSNIQLAFSRNSFTSFGPGVIPNSTLSIGLISLDLSHNAIASELSADAFDSNAGFIIVNLEDNLIAGSVPSGLLDLVQTDGTFQLSLANNKLTGTLPDSLFDTNHFDTSLQFNIASNPSLQGSIPSSLTKVVAGVNGGDVYLNFSSCAFSGAVPTLAINGSNMGTVVIDLSDNQLNNGSSGFSLSSFFSPSLNTDYGHFYEFQMDISNNKFEGALNFVNLPSGTRMLLHDIIQTGIFFNGSGNAFSQLVIDDSWTTTIKSLDVSNNLKMTSGALPHALFNSTTMLSRIYASNTGLNGTLPNIESEHIFAFDFRNNSGIDFCGSSRTAWNSSSANYLSACLLQQTNASYCPNLYPSKCQITALPPSPSAVVPAAVPSVRTPTGAANAVTGLSVAITIVIAVVLAMVM